MATSNPARLVMKFAFALLVTATEAGCVSSVADSAAAASGLPPPAAAVAQDHFVLPDQTILPFQKWSPADAGNAAPVDAGDSVEVVILALHGFNDYSRTFVEFASYAAEHGITSYAYDQRGFGDSQNRGSWAGSEVYVQDLISILQQIRLLHPQSRVYLLGHSMGGAVIMAAASGLGGELVDGLILAAPAVWARHTMPWYQRLALYLSSNLFPNLQLTGQSVQVTPSDNRDILIEKGRDPKVIKKTKVEAIEGLTDLMDEAFNSAPGLSQRTLILVGLRDEIIPVPATEEMIALLPANFADYGTIVRYEQGYHMLLEDLQRRVVWEDILDWIGE